MNLEKPSFIKRDQTRLYRMVWRWHFYAGLFCVPFIILLALSGGIYLFKPQINAWIDQDVHNLVGAEEGMERAPPQQIIQAALKAYPLSSFSGYLVPESAQDAVGVSLNTPDGTAIAYVDPYRLLVVKSRFSDEELLQWVKTFHGELLAGNVGSVLVETVGCWAIVLLVSGLYLWWPRNSKGLAGVLYPRLNTTKRIFWRDIHAVTGIWIAALLLFLLVSALPWTLVWGSAFKEIKRWSNGATQQEWRISSKSNISNINDEAGHAEHRQKAVAFRDSSLTISVVQVAQSLEFDAPVWLRPTVNKDQWQVQSMTQNRPLRQQAWIDGQTGNVTKRENFSDKSLIDRIVGYGIAAHEGQLFGWLNQLLGVVACLGALLLCVSGVVLWIKRKPAERLGAPPTLPSPHHTRVVVLIACALAVVLPVLAVSMLVILVLEKWVLARAESWRKWLGLRER